MSDEIDKAHQAGREAGRIDQVLKEHGEHLAKINGSIDRMVDGLAELTRVVTAQAAGQEGRDAAVKAAAEALAADAETKADAVEAIRSDRADALAGKTSKWTPRAVYVSAAGVVVAAGLWYLTNH